MNYPVATEQALGAIQRGWLSRRRRRDDVPELPPGAVYVFRVGGQYREYPEGMTFDPAHPDVVDASSVSLVDTRARLVEVERIIPSVSEADAFTIRVSFTCQVTDAATVARQGVVDATVPLRAYLAGDSELSQASAAHRVEEVNAVRDQVTRRMTAYTTIVPPRIAGMSVEFVGIEVLTPEDLRAWEQTMRNERWTRELARGKRDFEQDEILRLAELISQGSDHVDALGVVRDRVDIAAVASRTHRTADEDRAYNRETAADERAWDREQEKAERKTRNDMVLTVLRQMGEPGNYVDYQQVLQQMLDDGRTRPDGTPIPAVESGRRTGKASPGPGGYREPHPQGDFIKDEDDLVD